MKKMKALILVTLLILPLSSYAQVMVGLGYAPKAKGKPIDNVNFDDTTYLNVLFPQTSDRLP